jgi:hypothetical protein
LLLRLLAGVLGRRTPKGSNETIRRERFRDRAERGPEADVTIGVKALDRLRRVAGQLVAVPVQLKLDSLSATRKLRRPW